MQRKKEKKEAYLPLWCSVRCTCHLTIHGFRSIFVIEWIVCWIGWTVAGRRKYYLQIIITGRESFVALLLDQMNILVTVLTFYKLSDAAWVRWTKCVYIGFDEMHRISNNEEKLTAKRHFQRKFNFFCALYVHRSSISIRDNIKWKLYLRIIWTVKWNWVTSLHRSLMNELPCTCTAPCQFQSLFFIFIFLFFIVFRA